jgi:hypothetical protein
MDDQRLFLSVRLLAGEARNGGADNGGSCYERVSVSRRIGLAASFL